MMAEARRALLLRKPAVVAAILLLGCGGGGAPGTLLPDRSPRPAVVSTWKGVKQLGAAGAETRGLSIAEAAQGCVYVAGTTDGALEENRRTGRTDAYLAKYDRTGNKLYTIQYGAEHAQTQGQAVTTDASGDVYVAGWTTGTLDGHTPTGTRDAFLSRFTPSGHRLRTWLLGTGGGETACTAVATDADGNVYLAGWTTGGLDGRPQATGISDSFVARFDAAGRLGFVRQFGKAGRETRGQAMAAGPGGIYITGWTDAGLDGHGPRGKRDCFVLRLDAATGTTRFAWQFGAEDADTRGSAVAVDPLGGVHIAGWTDGPLEPGGPAATPSAFIARFDGTGKPCYLRQLGGTRAAAFGNGLSTDGRGCTYLVGSTEAGLDRNAQAGTTDVFLAKFDATGRRLYTRQLGTRGAETQGNAVATDGEGSVHITGVTSGRLGDAPSHGRSDVYLAKYDDAGDLQ
jgi:hypothetical protein